MKIYHVVTNASTYEIEAVKQVQPPYLMLSYYYFKNMTLCDFVTKIGYTPKEIILDSGAYSAFTKGKNISIIDLINYIKNNMDLIYKYIALDVIGDSELSIKFFEIMEMKNLSPIPVYHYGEHEKYLKYYIDKGYHYIALGKAAQIRDKKEVATWIHTLNEKYPYVYFHLLGSTSPKIIDHVQLHSSDSSSWFMKAVNGKPRHMKGTSKEAKIQRAIFNLESEIKKYNETSIL